MLYFVMSANDIIDLLGGTSAVARLCEVSPQAISQWRASGIPKPWEKYLRAVKPEVFSSRDSAESAKDAA